MFPFAFFSMAKTHSDIGLIGLAVMGQNLALNIADHGFRISVYNRTTEKTEKFVAENPNTPGGLVGAKTLEEFVASIAKPRKIIILVQAGKGTDAVIDSLVPLLDANDIVIDGGNALWTDTIRRERTLREKGLRFIGSGVSGGEEGARFGPALMPGGDPAAYKELEPIWNAVAAKVDAKTGRPLTGAAPGKPIVGGVPCATYIGENGAGKSTVLKTLFGLLKPRQGKVLLNGENINGASQKDLLAKGIAFVPQGRNLFGQLSVYENLELGGITLGMKTTHERIPEILEFFPRVKERLNSRAASLSGGEQKQLEIGRALLLRPKVLLIDEPSIGLSPIVVLDVFKLLRKLAEQGTTILMVEQNVKSALAYSDDAIALESNRYDEQVTWTDV